MKTFYLILLTPLAALAQLDLASIDGRITDPTGGLISGARVEIRNLETDIAEQHTTTDEGLYSAPLLRPGRYQITVEASGFKKAVRPSITLQIQDRLRLDFQLEVGQTSESIEVTAAAPLIETGSSTTGSVIDGQKISELPLNGRDWLRLARMAPGVVSTYRARDRSFTANGMRSIENTYVLDGVANVSYLRGLDNRRRDVLHPSVDALDEFKVQTSLFTAEYGQSAGAVVNATLKSGTNKLHGSLFEFGRNAAFDAKPYFTRAGANKPRFNQHQFGGTIGGPIRKDKTFIFFDYEGSREANSSPQTATIPSVLAKSGNFGSTAIFDPATTRPGAAAGSFIRDPFPGNLIPSQRFDPVAQKLLALYPEPNQGGAVNYVSTPSSTTNADQVNVRVDHRFGNKDSIFGRFSQQRNPNLAPQPLPAVLDPPVTTSNDTRGIAGAWIHNFGPTVVNELRYGYNRIHDTQVTNTPVNTEGIPNSLAPGVTGPPVISVSGFTNLGAQGNIPIDKQSQTHQVLDNWTLIHGRHMIKAGVDFRYLLPFTNTTLQGKGTMNFTGVYTQNPASRGNTGAPFADFLLGQAGNGTVGSRLISDERGKSYAAYVQDDWKVSSKLTLNLGLRYELAQPFTEANNHMANFIYAAGSPSYGTLVNAGVNGQSNALVRADTNNFAPRFGFAYQAAPKTVVRGGYGIFFGQDEGYGVVARMVGNPPFFVTVAFPSDQISQNLILSQGFPATAVDPKNAVNPALVAYPQDSPMPYVQQWGLNIQRELPGAWVLEVGYTGSLALKLLAARDLNQPLPGPGNINARRPFPQYGGIRAIEPLDKSHFHGLNARLEHRFTSSFTMLAAYTWGHVIDVASAINAEDDYSVLPQNSRDLRAEVGPAAYDIRQHLAISGIWELPFGKTKRWATGGAPAMLFGGWSLIGLAETETGRPFNITTSTDASNTGTTGRPNRLSSGVLPSDQRTVSHYFDVAALQLPAQFTFGNAARNVGQGPGRVNFDIAAHRSIQIRERASLQLRVELFNAFNHPQFGDPNGVIGTAVAGVISSTIVDQRQIQLGLRLAW